VIVEMIHTSAPAGLHGRHGGFTVVAATRGAPPPLLALLEPLSALELGPADREDPGSLALRRLRSGSSDWALLTRVLPCGVDHTGRRNRLAHHLAFDEESQRVERPADWILGFPFLDRWEEPPHELEEPRRPGPSDHGNPWGDAVGDAGWIDAILERCRAVTDVPITVLLPAGSDLRRLAGTLLARVESPATWRIGFATRWERSRARSSTRLRLLREDDPV